MPHDSWVEGYFPGMLFRGLVAPHVATVGPPILQVTLQVTAIVIPADDGAAEIPAVSPAILPVLN